ncbi:uncharacterized protein LOC8279848 [Ricinus communis]|uniref:Uncharacterized protein n=1 Tax=Ricinus communis TaxID=3988 RepID=B9T2U7_RICCO|nr:uncharacterized protein LOC8279848 [Ricinus communis]EEF29827.1 conserved hypothetical protein [Ricinus communis]|eukprot:XP_002532566.1 uncharacterized protein LOC8279848 [Ricinus communis]
MKPISRRRSSECYYRYLKPGALAQLRNSKISARSHNKPISIISLINHPVDESSPPPMTTHHQISVGDGEQVVVPCLVSKTYGPRCLKRKKLMAARSVFFLNLESADNDSSITLFNNDSLVAH